MAWRPGLFVTVQVLSQQAAAAVVVRSDAIQTLGDKPAVFVRSDEGFKAVAVKLGRSDGQRTEILGGLAPGQSYVATNSFVLKAELGKGSAEHEH
jgi:cobalt-zinc-cadmium efflux system membrane fusion protein